LGGLAVNQVRPYHCPSPSLTAGCARVAALKQ